MGGRRSEDEIGSLPVVEGKKGGSSLCIHDLYLGIQNILVVPSTSHGASIADTPKH